MRSTANERAGGVTSRYVTAGYALFRLSLAHSRVQFLVPRTQVAIIGAGPAGLVLGRLLHLYGIDSVVIELRSQEYVTGRVRAGVLEQPTVDLLIEAGLGERLKREGLRHQGVCFAFGGVRHYIDFTELTGKSITIYGQNELIEDLIGIRIATSQPLYFEAKDVQIADVDSAHPKVRFKSDGEEYALCCDFVAGCDGFHGICRSSIPAGSLNVFEKVWPFAWLGVVADTPPSSNELVYSHYERGFALLSMRTANISGLYLQCSPDDDISAWPDDRIWPELNTRLRTADGWKPNEGSIVQKSIAPIRSFVAELIRLDRLFLAGVAAHIVPPAGVKGLNRR